MRTSKFSTKLCQGRVSRDLSSTPNSICLVDNLSRDESVTGSACQHEKPVIKNDSFRYASRMTAGCPDLRCDRCTDMRASIRKVRDRGCESTFFPTLMVAGQLDLSDAALAAIGLRVIQRVESVDQSMREPGVVVDAVVVVVGFFRARLALELLEFAQAYRVRAAAIVYAFGSARALELSRFTGFHLFESVAGRFNEEFILAKLRHEVVVTFPIAQNSRLRDVRLVDSRRGIYSYLQ